MESCTKKKVELKSEERSINGTLNEIFSAFTHVLFHSGGRVPSSDCCWSILRKKKHKLDGNASLFQRLNQAQI